MIGNVGFIIVVSYEMRCASELDSKNYRSGCVSLVPGNRKLATGQVRVAAATAPGGSRYLKLTITRRVCPRASLPIISSWKLCGSCLDPGGRGCSLSQRLQPQAFLH